MKLACDNNKSMRRLAILLGSILLGATASAIGMGLFLSKANEDRQRLAVEIIEAQSKMRQAFESRDHAAQDAKQKLQEANAQIEEARLRVKALQDEHELFMNSRVLPFPSPRSLSGWKEALDLPLGVRVKYPPEMKIVTQDAEEFVLGKLFSSSDEGRGEGETPWFVLKPYHEQEEKVLLSQFVSSSTVNLVANQNVLSGIRGFSRDVSQEAFLLKVFFDGHPRFLLWVRDPRGRSDMGTVLAMLATLNISK